MTSRQLQIQITAGDWNAQRGAVLVVALILLLVLTLIGVTTMESTGMEMKMANQSRERLIATQAAEAGLRAAENYIETTGFSDAELSNTSCTTGQCFRSDCAGGGYCFNGANATNLTGCTLAPLATPVWENATLNVWSSNTRHQTLAAPNIDATVKYIVEFLCYIPNSASDTLSAANANLLFRITSLAQTKTGKSRVMLQSTYKVKPS
jgi:type IV pilus assembly protein PilX